MNILEEIYNRITKPKPAAKHKKLKQPGEIMKCEVNEKNLKGWLRAEGYFEDYQNGKISKGLLCERLAESIKQYIEERSHDNPAE